MNSFSILVADDIMAQTKKARKRSVEIRNIAASFARLFNADIHFLFVENIPERLRKASKIKMLDERNPQLISRLREELKSLHPQSELHVDKGSPILKILEWERKLVPDLMILGTRGQKGLSKLFLGSVAEELLRRSSIPVLVLGPHYSAPDSAIDSHKGLRILLLSDLTAASGRAETYARKLAEKTNGRLTLMHSVGDSIMRLRQLYAQSRFPMPSLEKEIRDMKSLARTEMKKKADRFRQLGLKVQLKLAEQDRPLTEDILEELSGGYDLVVMGTHGRNHLLTAFLGSTSRKVCLHATVPVIVLPSHS